MPTFSLKALKNKHIRLAQHESVDAADFDVTGQYNGLSADIAALKVQSLAMSTELPGPTRRSSTRPQPSRLHILREWWQEAVACIVFLAVLAALCTTLYAYTGKPSPDWPNWISLNTVIALYAVLFKAAILYITTTCIGQLKWIWFSAKQRPLDDLVKFDSATRGPSGAVSLLWRLRTRSLLSSYGAFIVLLSLAVDPFTQQLLKYYECPVPTIGEANIPRTNVYLAGEDSFHTGAGQISISPNIQTALNNGIYSPGGTVDFQCPTGNCTWEPYSTVGACSVCEDITHLLSFTTHRLNGSNHGVPSPVNITTSLFNGELSVHMTNNPPTQEYATMGGVASDHGYGPVYFILGQDPAGVLDPSTGDPFPNCNTSSAKTQWQCRGYGAAKCSVNACVKTYSANVNAGKLQESLIEVSTNWGFGERSPFLTMLDTQCLDLDEKRSLESLGYQFEPEKRWMAYNFTTYFVMPSPLNRTFPASLLQRNCVYGTYGDFWGSLSNFLSTELLNGTITGPNFWSEAPLGDFDAPQPILEIFNFGNVSFDRVNGIFAGIAESVTNSMRQTGMTSFSQPVLGRTMQWKPCVEVRWAWLTFPAVLALATLSLFVLLLFEVHSTKSENRVWKSSPLALVYHRFTDFDGRHQVEQGDEDLDTVRAMETLARATIITLKTSNGNTKEPNVEHGP